MLAALLGEGAALFLELLLFMSAASADGLNPATGEKSIQVADVENDGNMAQAIERNPPFMPPLFQGARFDAQILSGLIRHHAEALGRSPGLRFDLVLRVHLG